MARIVLHIPRQISGVLHGNIAQGPTVKAAEINLNGLGLLSYTHQPSWAVQAQLLSAAVRVSEAASAEVAETPEHSEPELQEASAAQ